MAPGAPIARSEIPERFRWNAESLFEDRAAFDAECARLAVDIAGLERHHGRLDESAAALVEVIRAVEDVRGRVQRLFGYAYVSRSVDASDSEATRMLSRAHALVGDALGAFAFLDAELLAATEARVRARIAEDERLRPYEHYFDRLYRRRAHVRSREVEELLGELRGVFRGTRETMAALVDSDFDFAPAVASDGAPLPFTQAALPRIYARPDRRARRTAWESCADEYLSHRHALASNLITSVRQRVFDARARGHASALERALFDDAVPASVYDRVVDAFHEHAPVWHRWFALRRRALGVERLHPYDVWAPLSARPPAIPYERAARWICEAMAPLGDDYVRALRAGIHEERWVDPLPNEGKRQGAFMFFSQGAHPFVVMSYHDDAGSLGTLAHELGHAMHSHVSRQRQRPLYGQQMGFVGEVASTFCQAMVRARVLETAGERELEIAILEDAMATFHRYLFVMPALAELEREVHTRAERGEGLAADDLSELTASIFESGFGSAMELDRARVGVAWAQYPHLYMGFYVYRYATGIAAAQTLAERVRGGEPGAPEAYLAFLRRGNTAYPIDSLRAAGVDVRSAEHFERAFVAVERCVDRLEGLLFGEAGG